MHAHFRCEFVVMFRYFSTSSLKQSRGQSRNLGYIIFLALFLRGYVERGGHRELTKTAFAGKIGKYRNTALKLSEIPEKQLQMSVIVWLLPLQFVLVINVKKRKPR